MKQLMLILLGLFSFAGTAQSLDTIFANENHNTALFFPNKVRQGIVGSSNFVFSYSQEKPQYFGLLKAIPGTSSNLLVFTQDGEIYSYVLSYKKDLSSFNYFIRAEESIGNEVTMGKKSAPVLGDTLPAKQEKKEMRQEKILKRRAEYYFQRSEGVIKSRREDGLSLAARDLFYFKDEVYLVLSLENRSGITFEPNYLKVYVTRGNKKRNSSYQRILKEPVYTYNFPSEVLDLQQRKFVLVFSKFTVGKNENIELEMREKKGNRYLKMRFRP